MSGSGSSPSSELACVLFSLGCEDADAAAPPLDGSATWKLWPSVTPSGTVRSYEAPSCCTWIGSPPALPGGQVTATCPVPPGLAPCLRRPCLMASGP